MDVWGKVALVTGAGAGIGRAVAERLAREGMAVVVADTDERGGAETVRRIEADGGSAAVVIADVAAEGDARAMVAFAVRRFGGLDVLVNNAGGAPEPHFPEAEPEHWGRTLDVNLRGVMLVTQFGVRAMRGRGGAIVNVSSRLASIGVPTMAMYSAAKGALLSLTRGAAVELAPDGIRVNAVAPGMTRTPLFEAWAAAERREVVDAALAGIPQGRFGTPEDVAAAIAFLASDEAAHITGASLPVDGGYTAA
jgi:NAD(P)-dependent dehydrogenase (short-subunit alcohol dehydrogenase family)